MLLLLRVVVVKVVMVIQPDDANANANESVNGSVEGAVDWLWCYADLTALKE